MQEWIIVVVWVLIGYASWDIFKTFMLNQYEKRKAKQKQEKEESLNK